MFLSHAFLSDCYDCFCACTKGSGDNISSMARSISLNVNSISFPYDDVCLWHFFRFFSICRADVRKINFTFYRGLRVADNNQWKVMSCTKKKCEVARSQWEANFIFHFILFTTAWAEWCNFTVMLGMREAKNFPGKVHGYENARVWAKWRAMGCNCTVTCRCKLTSPHRSCFIDFFILLPGNQEIFPPTSLNVTLLSSLA